MRLNNSLCAMARRPASILILLCTVLLLAITPPDEKTDAPPVTKSEAELIKDIIAKGDWETATTEGVTVADTPAEAVKPVAPVKPTKPGAPAPATIRACEAAPEIDGKLDDACWKTAAVAGAWVDVYTGLAAKPQPKVLVLKRCSW